MKKLFILSLVGLASLSATAQETTLQETRFTDNWSVGLNGGIVTPLTHHAFWGNARSAVGVQLNKDVTPVFGFGIESMWTIHTSESRTAFDASNLSLLGRVNMTNLFAGYRDEPRLFEIEAMAGAGWLHYYANGEGDANGWSTKAGLNLNFNLGLERAWTIAIKPAVVWNMDGNDGINDYANFMPSHYDVNHANFELTAGIVYHFKGSNGAHHFTRVRLYDPYEVDELNAKINDLREAVSEKDAQLHQANGRINALSHEVKKLRDRGPVIQTQTVTNTRETLESVITFRQGKSVIDASQQPNVERVATYLRNHREATVDIKGYASPEGSAEINEKIAQARAEAVKKMLVSKYKISSSRITAEGQGVGDMFSEPDWNRVSICTINENQTK